MHDPVRRVILPAGALALALGALFCLFLGGIFLILHTILSLEIQPGWLADAMLKSAVPLVAMGFVVGLFLAAAGAEGLPLTPTSLVVRVGVFCIVAPLVYSMKADGPLADWLLANAIQASLTLVLVVVLAIGPVGHWLAAHLLRFLRWTGAPIPMPRSRILVTT